MYRTKNLGNTIIRKEIRQPESDDIWQQISTYLILISKDYFPIDTGFFTASDGTTDIKAYRSINKGSMEDYRNNIQKNFNKYFINKWLEQ